MSSRIEKRLRTIRLLQRIEKQRLDSLGKDMAGIHTDQARLNMAREELQAAMNRSFEVQSPVAATYLGAYLGSARRQQRNLAGLQADLQQREDALSQEIREAYRNSKTNDVILEQAERERDAVLSEQERAATNEAALNGYLRAKAAGQSG